MFRANFCVVDTISSRQMTQLHGAVFILDLGGLSTAHVKACTPSTLRQILGLTNGFPMNIKGIHFINHPSIFNVVFSMAKMFMKPKMIKRVSQRDITNLSNCLTLSFSVSGQVSCKL